MRACCWPSPSLPAAGNDAVHQSFLFYTTTPPCPKRAMDAALQHVEHTCALLQSDPMGAGQILLALRSDPEAVSIARHVLEHSTMPAAHFHATGILQAALLGRWTELPLDERAAARNYLATLLLTHGDRYASFVTSQLLQTFAVLWKRGWAEEGAEGKTRFFQQVQALTQQAKQGQDHHHQQNCNGGAAEGAGQDEIVLASKFILALVGEFSTAKSAALGLPLEFHRQAHKAFETYGLLPCLELGIGMMADVVDGVLGVTTPAGGEGGAAAAAIAGERAELILGRLDAVVQLCVEILSWDFGGFDPLHEPSSTAPSFISPPITWRPFLLKLELFEALIEVYIRIRSFRISGVHQREQEARTHALRQLLTQLASLQGPIFPNGQERGLYAAFLVRAGVELLSQSMEGAMAAVGGVSAAGRAEEMEKFGPEIVALASFLQVCVSNFRLPVLATFSFFPDFCRRLSEVACRLLSVTAGMALEFRGADGDWTEVCEEGWAMEAFEVLLETWGVMVGEPGLDLLGGGGGDNSPPLGPVGVGGGEGGGKLDGSYGKGGREYDVVATRRVIVEAATPMYQAYQTCRVTLSRVEAARSVAVEEDEDEVAIAEMGTQEQVTGVAAIGRLAPATALAFLKHLLLDPPGEGGTEGGGKGGCFPRLHLLLTAGGGEEVGSGEGMDRSSTGVAALMEEVRVLVQGLGFLIADDFSGEQPAIPESIHRLCFQSSSYSSPPLLASSSLSSSSTSSLSFSSSPSPESTSALLLETCGQVHLLATFLLQRVIHDPNDPILSPYLTEAVLWFLTRWARTYVLPDTRLYRNGILAPSLLQAFGGEAGQQQVDGLLRLAWGFLTHWHSESDVAEAAIGLLRAVLLVGGGASGPAALRCDTWKVILAAMEAEGAMLLQQQSQQQQQHQDGHGYGHGQLHQQQQQHPPHIPPELGYIRLRPNVRGELLEVIVGGVLSHENDPEAPRALMQVANPLETRLQHLLLKLSSAAATASMKGNATAATAAARARAALAQEVGEVAGLYAGLAKAVDHSGQALLACLVTRALEPLVGAATQCGPYPETMHAVLEFLRNYAEVHISSLGAEATMALLTAAGQALKAYAAHNLGRTRKDANSKEEAVADMLCVLELLSYLATKDFIDFSAEHEGKVAADAVADVVFFGLERMIPLMTEEYLDFPPLGKQYFTLVNSMVSTYTGRVALLPHPLFMQLVQSVMFGVQRPDSEIARDSLRALAGLASFHAKACQEAQNGGGGRAGLGVHVAAHPGLLSDCMHKLLHMVVYEGSIWDRLDAASSALLALVLCDRDAFLRMVHGILEQQPPGVKGRLRHEFEEMVKAIPPPQVPPAGGGGKGRGMITDRQTKLAFRDRLKEFAKRVRPFMQMR